ncbi:hypothetical protein ABMA27_010463 [Loxostege sticticalis]|uniref:Uncharacterized protein n=1 Tax=Loxostege sticticalis TaxID=481309 RepID=A0ABR3H5U2_LOXSC
MNVTHSPPKTVTGGGSQPDLSKINQEITDAQITFRKRKQPENECSCSDEVQQMRSEISRITTLLEGYIGTNAQMLSQINNKVADIKSEIADIRASHEQTRCLVTSQVADICKQVQEIKSETSTIATEQKIIKEHLCHLETKLSDDETKLHLLETNIKDLKTSPSSTQLNQLCMNELVISEVQERKKRENNIIITGVPEQTATSAQERILKDESDVLKVASSVSKDIPKPNKIIRIGKYNPEKTRRIKVCFDRPEPAMLLLRNKDKLPEDIKIFSDQTPAQQKYFQSIKKELTRRLHSGESDITIKYINGAPTIVKSAPKNFSHNKH